MKRLTFTDNNGCVNNLNNYNIGDEHDLENDHDGYDGQINVEQPDLVDIAPISQKEKCNVS